MGPASLFWILACSPGVSDGVPGETRTESGYTAPDAPGSYAAGATTLDVVDTRGKSLRIEVWYPASPGSGDTPDPYTEIPLVSRAYREAPAVPGPWPIVAFSHGNGGIRYQSIFLTEWLAEHGFVVVAPDHNANTLLDYDESMQGQVALERPGDIQQAVAALLAEARSDGSRLAGVAAEGPWAVVGHSFGGWTAMAVGGAVPDYQALAEFCSTVESLDFCQVLDTLPADAAPLDAPDPDVVATVALAPAGWYAFGPDGETLRDVAAPLIYGGTLDPDETLEAEIYPTYDRFSAGRAMAVLEGAGHYAFTDLCSLAPVVDDCAEAAGGFIELDVAHAAIRATVTAWFGARLAGRAGDEAWLDDGPETFPAQRWSFDG